MAQFRTLIKRYFFVFDEPLRRWGLLLGAFILTSLLDIFGIGAMGIFLQAIVAPEGIGGLAFLPASLRDNLADDIGGHIVMIGVASLLLFTFRTVFSYSLQVYTTYFNNLKQVKIQRRLYYSYLHSPLLFRKKSNFSRMLYNVNFLTTQFIYTFSHSLFGFVSNAVLFFLMVLFLATANLAATVAICLIVLIASGFYYILIKDRSVRYGRLWAKSNELQLKNIREGIGALDEVQILGCQDYFQALVAQNLQTSFRYRLKVAVLDMIPRPLGEFLLLSFIVIFTVGYHLLVGDIGQISAMLGIFGMAGLRLVPAASHLSACLNGMKNASYAVHQLYEEMQSLQRVGILLREGEKSHPPVKGLTFERLIEVKDVVYAYPDGQKPVLDRVSLAIQKGERVAIVGRSGSGKTTLMNILLGNILPDSGTVDVDGVSILTAIEEWRAKIFYLPQTIYLLDDSIKRNIALGIEEGAIDTVRLGRAVQESQLAGLVASLPAGIETVVGDQGTRLSGGQRQRIGIARALYHRRDIIIMDEATSALDEETEAEVKESLRKLPSHVTVIMITHNLRQDDIFDQIIRLP